MNDSGSRDWHPSRNDIMTWTAFSVVLLVVGLMVFVALWSWRWGESSVEFTGLGMLVAFGVTLALVVVLMVAHEGLHGLAFRRFGGTPSYGAMMVGGVLPAFYCACPDTRFTRGRFTVVLLTPFVVLTLLCLAAILAGRWGGWLVLPAAFHLSGCIGDFAMVVMVARQPRGTTIEDLPNGVRLHAAG